MSIVNITNIIVENPQDSFTSNIKINITFEVLQQMTHEIEWKLIYVGSSKDEKFDQVLDQFCMGPLQQGVMQFTMETQAPNYTLIPTKEDLFGVTALILLVSYQKKEFFRCGYYVYNNYVNQELIENDPPQVLIDQLCRHIYGEMPRVTKYNITWDNSVVYNAPQIQTNHVFMFQQENPQNLVLNDLTNYNQEFQQTDAKGTQQQFHSQEIYGEGNQVLNMF